jgi:hypothetical protein
LEVNRMNSRHLSYPFVVLVLFISACCSSGELETMKQELADARAAIESKDSEIASLQQQLSALETENTTLKQTAQYHYNSGVDALASGDWASAETAFTTVVERFPNDPLVPDARAKIHEASDGRLRVYLERVDSTLSLSDKGTYSAAVVELEGMIGGCGRCSNLRAAESKLSSIKQTLDEWPEEITSIQSMKVRYSDLRGKPLSVSQAVIAASTYYNCRYDSDNTWRSFDLALAADTYDDINAYCRKGREACEQLFKQVASGEATTINDVQLRYPSSNSVCAEGQIELLSWR